MLLPVDANGLTIEAPIVSALLSLLFGVNAVEAIRNQRAERAGVVRQKLLGLCAVVRCQEHLRQIKK